MLIMSNIYGKNLKILIFGQSHSAAVGVTIDGLPAGFKIDFAGLRAFLQRRMPGQGKHTTKRRESDEPEFLSGLVDGVTCGAPLTAIIRNTDIQPSDYDPLWDIPRPSHADYTAYIKYGETRDVRGGGAFSGRLTAPLCVAGGICLQLLKRENINISAHIVQIGSITDSEQMLSAIEDARQSGDSLGGIIECSAVGVPAGIGEPMFDGMENRIASIIFGIPAVKGIEFGNGFAAAGLRGSENNDAFIMHGGVVQTRTNNHGGILGGITSGMPVLFRVAFKPTPSISMEQDSISLSKRENVKLTITGRHDPCIVPRAVPCVEAAAAIAVYDLLSCCEKRK
jgi:chorismate synthase